jgi:serine/threonine protein kinase
MSQNETSLTNILVGDQLGPYKLVSRLGGGGMAETFVAIRTGPGKFTQRVCLKLVLPFYREDEDFARLFEREARLAAKLRHSNIVGVIDFGDIDGISYMALELVDGLDLRALLDAQNDNRLPSDFVVLCGLAIAHALEHAHKPLGGNGADDEGIVHRDISPSNVLISRRGEVLLTDFGVAKAISSTSRKQSAVKGKVPYMAPEYLRSEPLDGRADLFALGVVLFESLAGERPYEGEHDPAIIMRILKGEHPPLTKLAPEAPQGLCQIIERLLEPDRENRPPNATVVIEVLDEFAPSSKVRRRLGQQVTDLRDHAEQNPLKSASRSNPKQTEALPETPGQKTGKSGTREAQPAEQAVGAKPSLEVPGAPEPTPPTFASGQTGTQAKSRRNLTLVALAAVLALGGVAAATAGLWVDTEETEESAETDALQVESDQRAGGDLPTEEPGSPAEDTLAGGEDTSDRASPSTERRAAASSPSSLGIKVRRTMDGANSSVVPRNVRSRVPRFRDDSPLEPSQTESRSPTRRKPLGPRQEARPRN